MKLTPGDSRRRFARSRWRRSGGLGGDVIELAEGLARAVEREARFVVWFLCVLDEFDRLLLPPDRVFELTGLGVSGGERVEVARDVVSRQLAGALGVADRGLPVANVVLGACRLKPGEVVEGRGIVGVDVARSAMVGESRREVSHLVADRGAKI